MGKYKCPCCGNYTLAEEPPGTYEICMVCEWEDDRSQFLDPDYRGGANRLSLNEARRNYEKFREEEQRFEDMDDPND
ncbi:CPCC family cysteine-rich protein [Anaerobium acetethylicum]|uniref:Cysteine-rich CPCC n=1 Tax=Anaerobium acetethylicum TaxID=1619234 RepID=A0A1D3TQG8_9FIRM|nr:CPCC family cysteine-rich protein [Anaerobium acetethylicum]SCP95809.1 Cysteine-rich CPCC [Anaerobium acetethylicum]